MKYIGIIIIALIAVHTEAQISDSLSDKLLHQETVYWQAKSDSARFDALLQKAKLDRSAGLYSNALHELYRAEAYGKDNKRIAELGYERMVNYFLSNDFSECSKMNIDSSQVSGHYNDYMLMKLYSLNETERWDTCKILLLKLCKGKDTMRFDSIRRLPVNYKRKDPLKAKRLSAILPGLGEIYAGYPFKGITSFVLNTGFLFFAGYNYYTGYYVTGTVLGVYPVLRFYSGGKRLSSILANRHNAKQSAKLKKEYWEEISSVLQ